MNASILNSLQRRGWRCGCFAEYLKEAQRQFVLRFESLNPVPSTWRHM